MYHICLLILVGVRSATASCNMELQSYLHQKLFIFVYFQASLKVLLYSPAY